MKLISLNTWGGKIYKPLMTFIKKHSQNTDIFCFQEVFSTSSNIKILKERRINLYEELQKILKDYNWFFYPQIKNFVVGSRTEVTKTDFDLYFGLSIFCKKGIKVISEGDFFLYGKRFIFDHNNLNTLPRSAQYINFEISGRKFTVVNIHGIWLREDKQDSASRKEQSRRIKDFLDQQTGGKILCGDFNLDINTKSIQMLEDNLINLIKKYHIHSTRNSYFPGKDKFADYTFVSPDINVTDFEVPQVEISDHLPLILEFS